MTLLPSEVGKTRPCICLVTEGIATVRTMARDDEGAEAVGSDEESEEEEEKGAEARCMPGRAGLLMLLLTVVVCVIALGAEIRDQVLSPFLEWVGANGALGVFAYACAYAAAVVLFVPASVLTIGAGFVFTEAFGPGAGFGLGVLCVFVGACAGANAAFGIGRYVAKDTVRRWAAGYKVLHAVDLALGREGLKLNVLMRLSPVIPFSAFNYVIATTRVRWSDFATALGAILPGTCVYVYVGVTASQGAGSIDGAADQDETKDLTIGLLVAGVVASMGALVALGFYSKQQFDKIVQDAVEKERKEKEEAGGALALEEASMGRRTVGGMR